MKTSFDLINGKLMMHKHQDLIDALDGDTSEYWTGLSIGPTATGIVNLGDYSEYQGFVMNYMFKIDNTIQSGVVCVIHNTTSVTTSPYHEYYYVGSERDVVFSASLDFSGMVELNIENNTIEDCHFKYRVTENIELF